MLPVRGRLGIGDIARDSGVVVGTVLGRGVCNVIGTQSYSIWWR